MIGEGRTFEAVAKEIAGMEGEALEFGEFGAGGFPIPALMPMIDALDEGAISEPVATDFGWNIFRVSAIQPESVRPYEDVRGDIEDSLKKELAGDLLYDMSATLEDELAGGATLEGAAAALNVEIRKSGLIDIEGAGVDGEKVDGLPGGEFINSAFFTPTGKQSALGQSPDGSYYILRVDESVPSALRPLEEVRDEIVADWQAGKQREAAEARALAIVERVENGGSLTEIATAEGLEATDSNPFNRRGEGADSNLVTPLLVSDVFKLQPGQAAMVETGDGFVVAQLKSVKPAGPSDTKDLASLIGNQITGDILRQLDDALRQEFKVDIDEAALARTPLAQ
jgi:peptidyl-prolyl cis-trans isomerase D